jgi:ABC-2 type transport system ATP-binding protein
MIEFQDISKSFGSTKALANVSFSVPAGQITAFIGPNGAGKTTSMRIMTQTLEAGSGTYLFQGQEVSPGLPEKSNMAIRRKIGYLSENNPLYSDFLTGEYLLMTARMRGLTGERTQSAIDRVRDLCQLRDVMHKPVFSLSKGFRQRLGVAQALIHDPDVLILDEPTSGLDPNQSTDFLKMLQCLQGTTILLSTHILHSIPEYSQKLIFLDDGKLGFQGDPQQFRSHFSSNHTMDQAFRAWTEA